ncbi:RHS repeat-associated core domain-containing protein [Flavobacterium sp. B183]|uniref:RHS repeat-associated core domain-containing protein n=1 Tax=Flavobacterium sp. B183 TaxID=907046 RepID=UPI00201EA924|nr:RHS repeat-associated core domain-containing protein [Flavobacterium sp. B183]URC11763.1 hypothetical protein M4I44_16900 [Flavobacterium sp. B183]
MQFFSTAEGYYDYISKKYVYQYKDHLGNVRVSYAKNPVTQVLEILEESNYYPFGLKHTRYNDYVASNNKYKYNGKELQDELGLNMYDYHARNYDPAIGCWMNIDPLAEHYPNKTPYHYCSNSPINRIDPTGMCDDPNCPHGAIRRGWDAIGRFFGGAWGHSKSNTTAKKENVKAGPIQEVDPQSPEEQEKYAQDIRNLNDNFGGIIEGMIYFITLTGGGEVSEGSTVVKESQITKSSLTIEAGGVFSESEVAAAKFMEGQGNNVVLRIPQGTRAGGGTSDLLVNGVAYDVYTPTTNNVNRIISSMASKNSQTTGIVLDLSKTNVEASQLSNALQRVRGTGATNITDIRIIPK